MKKNNYKDIINRLQSQGFRLTTARLKIINILVKRGCKPIAVNDLMMLLDRAGVSVNKTTVYRELDFLKSQHLVREIDVLGGSARYELNDDHHHHIICTQCDTWLPIAVNESFIAGVKKSAHSQKATITGHLLEFFGLCKSCKKSPTKMRG